MSNRESRNHEAAEAWLLGLIEAYVDTACWTPDEEQEAGRQAAIGVRAVFLELALTGAAKEEIGEHFREMNQQRQELLLDVDRLTTEVADADIQASIALGLLGKDRDELELKVLWLQGEVTKLHAEIEKGFLAAARACIANGEAICMDCGSSMDLAVRPVAEEALIGVSRRQVDGVTCWCPGWSAIEASRPGKPWKHDTDCLHARRAVRLLQASARPSDAQPTAQPDEGAMVDAGKNEVVYQRGYDHGLADARDWPPCSAEAPCSTCSGGGEACDIAAAHHRGLAAGVEQAAELLDSMGRGGVPRLSWDLGHTPSRAAAARVREALGDGS